MNKEILRLAIPNILTNLTVPLVSLVDVALMGRMPSTTYIVAIGLGTIVFNFLYWAFGFLRMGTTGLVSQAFGRDDKEAQLALLKKGLSVSIFVGILIIILQIPLKWLAIQLVGTNPEANFLLAEYIDLRIWAAPATISVYVFTGWLLGMQDSKSALWLAAVINGFNALLSYLFVFELSMDIQGVALGTVIAQGIGFLFAVLLITKKYKISLLKLFRNREGNYEDKSSSWKEFISVNSDILIRTLCLILTLSFFKAEAASIDPILGAANILLMEFITISAYAIDGFAFAAESISGKYFGKANRSGFIRSVKYSFLWGILIALLLSAVFYFLGEAILNLLTDKSMVVDAALPFLFWLILAPLVNTFAFIWDGIFIGTTSTASMRNTMLLAMLLFFLPAYYILYPIYGNHGLWAALTIFMLARGILLSFYFKPAVLDKIK